MRIAKRLLLVGLIAGGLAGCSTFDKLTGSGVDDTVLKGQREDAIPGRTQFPEAADPEVTRAGDPAPPPADDAAACPPDDPACAPPMGDDTFSDPQ